MGIHCMILMFWLSCIGVLYSYFIYPFILLFSPKIQSKIEDTQEYSPSISLIITAYNESDRITQKIINTLEIDYPKDKLEIIVASDASDDDTDSIVKSYEKRGVRLVRAEERRGKEHAQYLAIQQAKGEILIFSDVATIIPADAIRKMTQRFADSRIGGVSSEDKFISQDGKVVGEGAYVKYEMWLRRLESKVGGLIGLSGSFFAARKSVCENWDTSIPSDFNTALNCIKHGYIAVSDPEVVGHYKAIKNEKKEYKRKYRTVLRGISALVKQREMLNPVKYGFNAFQAWSHKVMRWMVPWFLILLFISSITLYSQGWIYLIALIAQLIFYGLAIAGVYSEKLRAYTYVKIPYFFVQVNIAIAHATLAYLFGKRLTLWEPSKR